MRPQPSGIASVALLAILAVIALPACGADATLTRVGAHYAQVRGLRMYYEIHGSGPALVLLHGGAGNGMQFEHQVPAFERRFRVIVPDLCSQGRTTDRDGPVTFHDMAEDVLALMDRLGVRRFDVMGWSDGGVIGLDLGIHHGDRLRRLVTFGANFAPDGLEPADVAWNDTATVAGFGDGMREGWQKLAPDPSRYESAMRKILYLWKNEPRFTPAQLGSIRAKVLVCAGDHDVVRRDHTEALAAAIPGAELWIVPNASHSAMQEKPDEVNARVVEFLARP